MTTLVSKTWQNYDGYMMGFTLTDSLTVSSSENYKTNPIFSGAGYYFGYDPSEGITVNIIEISFNTYLVNGRSALWYDDRTGYQGLVSFAENTGEFAYTLHWSNEEFPDHTIQNSGSFASIGLRGYGGEVECYTNIPVFSSEAEARSYVQAISDAAALLVLQNAINYKDEYTPEKTKVYTYSSFHANVSLLRGSITKNSDIGYRTLKFQANKEPAFYMAEGDFGLTLIAEDVVASIYVPGPESVIDNIPDSQWTEGSLEYNGPFYCSLNTYVEAFENTPGDGDYIYPVEFQTNIPIYGSREDAEEAIRTGDNSKAIRRGSSKEYDVKIGEEEQTTEFGGGGFVSPFMTILSGSKSDMQRLKDVLFTDDSTLWDNIKKGLEMYGSNPIDYIISCKVFGFDVSKVVNESTRYDVWFGSYKHHFSTPFNEVINMAHKYISAGSFFMYPIQYCYLDFEPYTTLSAYFPYHGWERLDIKKYYQKQVEVRYYVDILTGQGVIVTLCNGILTDQFGPCEMGTELPLTGANYAQWAQGQVRLLTQSASSLISGVANGATSGSVAGFAVSSLTSLIPASQGLQEARQMGSPKNTMITRGNFSSNLGNYFPGYVIFRFDIHEMLEPNLLRPLVGRPSYSSGNVRNFSGFLSGKVVKLDTTGMSESEADAVRSLIRSGIYV